MIRSEDDWADTLGAFHAAALGLASWEEALRGLARATGSKSGELIGIEDRSTPAFTWISDFPVEEARAAYAAVRGHDPQVNSRVRAGARAAELRVLADGDEGISIEEDSRRSPDYGEVVRRYDTPYICLSTLVRRSGLMVGLAALRSQRQGPINADERRVFGLLAPHVRTAVLSQIALQENAAALTAGALEAVELTAFVCDFRGAVKAMSPAAEALLRDGRLKLRDGRLAAREDGDTRALTAMIHDAAFARTSIKPPPLTLVLRDEAGHDPLLVDVTPVPGGRSPFGLGVAALVVVRSPRLSEVRDAARASALFSLTPAEAHVVAALMAGRTPPLIARDLGVSVGTVRTHVRHLFEKVGVRSLIELVAAVSRRL